MDCKKCGKPITREWVNKRQQRMGKCGSCGKIGYLGKAETGAEAGEHKEAPRPKARGKKTKQRPRAVASSRAGAGSGEQPTRSGGTFFERVTGWLDRNW